MKNLEFIGFPMYAVTPDGRVFSLFTNRFLKLVEQNTGYSGVTLQDWHVKENWLVHRLVALAFVDNPDPALKIWVNHKDGVKANNQANNLEWVTPQENSQHAVDAGLRSDFKRHYRPISDALVHSVCKLIVDNWRNCDIEKATGVAASLVAKIRQKTHYTDVVRLYDFSNVLSSRRKVSDSKALKICEMLADKIGYSQIMRELAVGYATIKSIAERRAYCHISRDFHF